MLALHWTLLFPLLWTLHRTRLSLLRAAAVQLFPTNKTVKITGVAT